MLFRAFAAAVLMLSAFTTGASACWGNVDCNDDPIVYNTPVFTDGLWDSCTWYYCVYAYTGW